ncbi:MAG: hypothetical protein KME35_05645 [Aphanocapsa sp. GSE-SYN-MK-11-07L]|jgi:hypothetical protein|nr:hypothetical protein [Aphanocapsa sp. GSE-SYN-MK-11-07L]
MTLSNPSDRSAFGEDETLYRSIKALIERSRTQVVAQINQTLVLTYWQNDYLHVDMAIATLWRSQL